MYNSDLEGSFSEQSANLPGNDPPSRAFFLIIRSLAFLAASLARAEVKDLLRIFFASSGLSSTNSVNLLPKTCSTAPLTSGLPNLPFVCPSNCGSLTFTDTTHIKPSLTSSPDKD